MAYNKKLSKFSLEDLKTIRESIIQTKTKEELLATIDSLIKEKYKNTQSMNNCFLVDWFNIDRAYIELLHANGINNLDELRNIEISTLRKLPGMTEGGYEQIAWARDFFDMTSIEKIKPKNCDQMTVAKVIVKNANKNSKKYHNV